MGTLRESSLHLPASLTTPLDRQTAALRVVHSLRPCRTEAAGKREGPGIAKPDPLRTQAAQEIHASRPAYR